MYQDCRLRALVVEEINTIPRVRRETREVIKEISSVSFKEALQAKANLQGGRGDRQAP